LEEIIKQTEWISKMPKRSLSQEVVAQFKEAFIKGELKPGDYLPSENELVEKFGVGKSSLREAIKMMQAIGIVEIIKGKGTRVCSEIQPNAINSLAYQLIFANVQNESTLFEFRKMVEVAASKLAIQKASDEDIKLLEDSVKRLQSQIAQKQPTIELDIEFHHLVYQSTHNPFIIQLGKTLMDLFRPSIEISNRDRPDVVLGDHKRICRAFVNRSVEEVERAILTSLANWSRLTFGKGLQK
jgi:GntR family transcriptional repressor for pyruvate dehydrogenase complex